VSSVNGTSGTTTSLPASSSGSETRRAPSRRASGSGSGIGSQYTNVASKPRNRVATARPSRPIPMMPTVAPARPLP